MSAFLLTDSSGRPYDPAFMAASGPAPTGGGVGIAAAQQSPVRGHITPMDRRQKFVLTGEAGRIVRQKMRWLKANSHGAIASRVAAWEGPVHPDPFNTYNTPEWIDGVKVDSDHAHLAYRIINDSKPGAPWRALQDVVDAADCFFPRRL